MISPTDAFVATLPDPGRHASRLIGLRIAGEQIAILIPALLFRGVLVNMNAGHASEPQADGLMMGIDVSPLRSAAFSDIHGPPVPAV